ncbi:uncharacterized protein LOC133116577 isoform X2 [Conger conger]|uniref:uncharacterized protein LOC133116577 isoform X2 n=1 Tax=Conger conger TaxID=82655 RepID=UPI002A5AECE0|nr:uncharacterized protein LOC133116577 isoform X2 [Conger conger]
MDVRISLSVSLLRDQLGTVIEQAVTNAVETVLGEMLKVVGCKFDEFSKEMTAKEKENESIKKMLEISRCQMKTMRKYLSAVSAKDERPVPVNQKYGKQTLCQYRGELQFPNQNWTRKAGDGNFTPNERAERLLNDNQIASLSEGLPRTIQLRDGTAIKDQVIAVKESQDTHSSAPNLHPKDYIHIKEEHRDPLERPGGCHSREGFCETEPSQGGSTEVLDFDPSLHKLDNIAVTTMGASPQAKEEEAEMQLICIKEEPPELEIHTLSPQPPDRLSDPCPDQGGGQDRAGPTDCLMGTALPTMSSPTCWDGQARRGGIRPQGELQTLRQQRAELQRRSQLRRRERERSLPQALQVAMERERREKTRIRVARWRAKRKMQAAGLMTSQPTQLDYGLAQSVQMHANDALRCRQQYGSLMYGSAQYENGALYPPLHIGQELTDALVQSEVTVVQQGILGSDSELFQQSEFEA